MRFKDGRALITAVANRCKVCYTCVRECPVKAIKIHNGQAKVIGERCIGCGNCIKVCSQNAKEIISSKEFVQKILAGKEKCAAIIAPSFPVEFSEYPYQNLVGAVKQLGFDYIHEVGFGADLVTQAYLKQLEENPKHSYISSSCPAVVAFIEKYHPQLATSIIPIISPMVATARVVKEIYGKATKVVFIGPCLAKKGEKERPDIKNDVNEVLTFGELRQIFKESRIDIDLSQPRDFDLPQAGQGNLYPISRGALQAANIVEDLLQEKVIAATGRTRFVEAIKEFSLGYLEVQLIETLCCDGCIMGAGITNNAPIYKKRHLIREYVKQRIAGFDEKIWQSTLKKFQHINLECQFVENDQRLPIPDNKELVDILKKLGKYHKGDELNCGACGYESCREHGIAISKGLAENEMCLPYVIEKLKTTVGDLESSYQELKDVKEELNHREKLASMGQLAAGIAHEINNPLGIVLMYAHIILEQYSEKDAELSSDMKMIVEQAERCKKIVSGLLNFARQNKVKREKTNIVILLEKTIEDLNIPDTVEVKMESSNLTSYQISVDKDQIHQVLLNIMNNALDSMENQGTLTIQLNQKGQEMVITIEDSGCGMSEEVKKRVFEPFFTTKQIGKGTGLGLPISYGIIKMHSGRIEIESNDDETKGVRGTKVHIILPLNPV
ncbi:MAG: ATP-binding protein [Spirochaetes bacterium]|nr:ATP-binding protein [Spirochaetota bacterium]